MADNSNNRKKTLIVSVLLFLLAGGGIFLFFVIQGSNDITGSQKGNFYYGGARESVSSFFKYIGIASDDEDAVTKKYVTAMAKARGVADGTAAVAADVSDWMAPSGGGAKSASASAPARGATSVPKMGGGGASGVGGTGAGGSKSSGGASRFGEGSDKSNTKITGNAASGAGGPAGKGSFMALSHTRAMLGDGLNSGSAMTAKGKWDSSFGVGNSARGSELAYGKSGLVGLDKIKKGEVDNLKTTDIKSLKTPEPGAFKEDKAAEKKDVGLQKAKDTTEADAKKALAESLAKSAATPTSGTAGDDSRAGGEKPPAEVLKDAKSASCTSPCALPGTTMQMQDKTVSLSKYEGGYKAQYDGVLTDSTSGKTCTYQQVVVMPSNGGQKSVESTALSPSCF